MSHFGNEIGKVLTGVDNAKAQEGMGNANQQMQQFINQQMQTYGQAMPQYNKVIDYFSNRAGLGHYAPGVQNPQAVQNPSTGHYSEAGYTPPAPTKYAGLNNQGQAVSRPRPINNYQGLPMPGQAQTQGQPQGMINPLTGKRLSGMGDPSGGGIFGAVRAQQPRQQPQQMPQQQMPQQQVQQMPQGLPMPPPPTPTAAPVAPRPQVSGPVAQPPSPQVAQAAPQQTAAPAAAPAAPQQMNTQAQQMQQNPFLGGPARAGGVNNQQLGIYNGTPEDQLRNAAAQDDIDRMQMRQQSQLQHQLGQRGMLDSSIYGGSLAQMGENALQNYSDYRRQLAIGAGGEQDQRMQNLMQALNPAMGGGMQAQQGLQNMFGNQQGLSQQSSQALQGLFNAGTKLAGMFMM